MAHLVEENHVLEEWLQSGGGRLRFTDDQRRRLAAKGKPLGRKALQQIATIVALETIPVWHRRRIATERPTRNVILHSSDLGRFLEFHWARRTPTG